jgi:hypothetical protein
MSPVDLCINMRLEYLLPNDELEQNRLGIYPRYAKFEILGSPKQISSIIYARSHFMEGCI